MNTKQIVLDAYLVRTAAIHAKLEHLQQLADSHFGHGPTAIHCGHVGDLGRVEAGLDEACSVTVLDKLVREELPSNGEDLSALDELVALARAQCQLHHDPDRKAVAIIPMPDRREVWRVYSSGFEDWLRAAYWRAKEAGVAETTMKSALATLAAAGINDGDKVEIHVLAACCQDGVAIVCMSTHGGWSRRVT